MHLKIDYPAVLRLVSQTKALVAEPLQDENIHVKGRADFVTDADLAVQNYVKDGLQKLYPDILFMGEETGYFPLTDKPAWILDPIDGTQNFIKDYGLSACSLALYDGKEIVFGVVYHFFADELFYAVKGQGAYRNGSPIRAAATDALENSIVSTGTSPYYKELAEENFHVFREVFKLCNDTRRLGSAAIDLAYVACGRQDAYLERRLKAWDCAAGLLLVQEAGGCACLWNGGEIRYTDNMDIIAACRPVVLQELLELTRQI